MCSWTGAGPLHWPRRVANMPESTFAPPLEQAGMVHKGASAYRSYRSQHGSLKGVGRGQGGRGTKEFRGGEENRCRVGLWTPKVV